MGRSTSEGTMEGDTAKCKMGAKTSEGNMNDMENKQTQINFYGNNSLTFSTSCIDSPTLVS